MERYTVYFFHLFNFVHSLYFWLIAEFSKLVELEILDPFLFCFVFFFHVCVLVCFEDSKAIFNLEKKKTYEKKIWIKSVLHKLDEIDSEQEKQLLIQVVNFKQSRSRPTMFFFLFAKNYCRMKKKVARFEMLELVSFVSI